MIVVFCSFQCNLMFSLNAKSIWNTYQFANSSLSLSIVFSYSGHSLICFTPYYTSNTHIYACTLIQEQLFYLLNYAYYKIHILKLVVFTKTMYHGHTTTLWFILQSIFFLHFITCLNNPQFENITSPSLVRNLSNIGLYNDFVKL